MDSDSANTTYSVGDPVSVSAQPDGEGTVHGRVRAIEDGRVVVMTPAGSTLDVDRAHIRPPNMELLLAFEAVAEELYDGDEQLTEAARKGALLLFSDRDLGAEFDRRTKARLRGSCDACGRWYESETCGNPRHADAARYWYRRWRLLCPTNNYLTAVNGDIPGITVDVHRYGTVVKLDRMGERIAQSDLPSAAWADDQRLHWAIDWAIEQLAKTAN